MPPDAAMRAIIESMGIDQVLKIAGLSAQERAEFKRREREVGRARMIDEVLELMREELPDFGAGMPPAPGPGTRGAPPGGGPKGKRKTPRATDPEPPDDDAPEQFELF
jgi:hypothetical protein